jgi:putative ABC transport system permease protein
MQWLRRLTRRVRLFLRRDAAERAMASEIAYHIECETEALIRQGLSPADARRRAALLFGGVEGIKEEARDVRGIRALEDVLADLRYAARLLRRNPGFTLASVLTFCLGVGVATAIFSVVYGVLLRPLPFARPERLVALWERDVRHDRDRNVVSLGNFDAWRERARSFDGMAALMPISVTIADGPAPERVVGADVSPGYFRLLGVAPALGRDFDPGDARDEAVTILSDGYWKRHYGGDAAVVGRSIVISGRPHTIVGVMPSSFDPPRFGWLGAQALWFPMVPTPQKVSWGRFLLVVARLRDGVTAEQARAELLAIAAQREAEVPGNEGWSASLVPLAEQITGDARTTLLVLLGAVTLLLVMAVTNVGTLTLSAMRRRAAELAVRRAIGATDRRLFRQLFVQSALLAVIGTAAGLLVAPLGVRLLLAVLPPEIPRASSIRVDAPVLAVASVVAMLATIVFGSIAAIKGRKAAIVSAISATRGDTRQAAAAGGGPLGGGPLGGGPLVAVEIALALALSVMAILMVRSLGSLRAVDLGFEPGGVAVARVGLPGDRYRGEDSQRVFFDRLVERARALPGVRAAGILSARPLGGIGPATTVGDAQAPASASAAPPIADVRYADAAVFDALRMPLVAGRFFDPADTSDPVKVVITRDLAETLWPDGRAVGRRLSVAMYDGITADVIGVVGTVHLMDPRTAARPVVYLSTSRFPGPVRDLVVRADVTPASLVPALRALVTALDPSLPLYAVTTLPELVDETLASDRFTTFVLTIFAAGALLLAGVGVVGVLAGDVTRRRQEIGIRLALGARGGQVVALLLRQVLRRAAAGAIGGTVLAALLARGMGALLFGVRPSDPVTLIGAAVAVVALALAATAIPAFAALRRSPLSALREG